MPRPSFDILIIGAGAAGLAAASTLARAGRSVLLVEARDRIGGRIWTLPVPGLAVPVEFGAEFIHGNAQATMALLEQGGKTAIESADSHYSLQDGQLLPGGGFFREVEQAMRHSDVRAKEDMSFADYLDHHLAHELSENARDSAKRMAEGFDAADTTRASARALAEEWTGDVVTNAAQSRPLGGYDSLLGPLASSLHAGAVRLQLQTSVHAVRWGKGSVAIEGTFLGKPFQAVAPRAVITVPLAVLQLPADAPGALQFTPTLHEKQSALRGLASGPVIKIVLRFASAFWEEIEQRRYRDASFFHSAKAEFPTFWTQMPTHAPLLVAWAGGPRALRLAAGSEPADIVRKAIVSLQSTLGRQYDVETQLEAAYYHDWQQDPYARGAYSYVLVGGDDARQSLARPIEDTLFFAGEATDTEGDAATVNGALQSGLRAAREALAAG